MNKNKQKSRNNRFNITLSDDEKEIIKQIKEKHSINISNYVRQSIRKLYEELNEKKCI